MAEFEDDCECNSSSSEEENLDPRIQEELECLNSASNEINTLETEVDNARTKFRSLLGESTQTLNVLFKKIGNCINKVRPYYELVKEARKAQAEAQRAVVNYQRATGIYRAAMETVQLAETRAVDETVPKREFDQAWQEVLNHATMRFMESEADKAKSEEEHMKRASEVARIQQQLKVMEKKWNRTIPKSRPYFELKEKFELQLEQQKVNVEDLQRALNAAKKRYKGALEKLEEISNSVHEKRRKHIDLPPRTPGVGAESNSSTCDLPAINLELISQCSDEAFEDFDDDVESVNSDSVSICSEGKQSSVADKSVKSHRRYKSCDVKALIASANRTTSVDEGYSTSTKSDTSSDSQSPEISPLPDQADIPLANTNLHSTVEVSSKDKAAIQSDKSAAHTAKNLQKTGVLVAKGSTADVIKQASSLNQDLLKLSVSKASKETVTGMKAKPVVKGNAQAVQYAGVLVVKGSTADVIKQASSLDQGLSKLNVATRVPEQTVTETLKPQARKPAKLQTKAALPLLDIATISKDRAYTF